MIRKKYFNRYLIPVIVIASIYNLASCNALKSTIYKKPSGEEVAQGIPYLLPTGMIEVSLEVIKNDKGEFESVDIISDTKLMPDMSQLYVINPVSAFLTHKNQSIELDGGMLKSVTTNDDGQADEIIKSAIGTWVNISKVGVLSNTIEEIKSMESIDFGNLPTMKLFSGIDISNLEKNLEDNTPYEEIIKSLVKKYSELNGLGEVLEILKNLSEYYMKTEPNLYQYFAATNSEKEALLINSNDLSKVAFLGSNISNKNIQTKYFDLEIKQQLSNFNNTYKYPANGPKTIDEIKLKHEASDKISVSGIMVKVPEPIFFKAQLSVNSVNLYLFRLKQYNAKMKDLRDEHVKIDATVNWEHISTSIENWNKNKEKIKKEILELEESIANSERELKTCTKANPPNCKDIQTKIDTTNGRIETQKKKLNETETKIKSASKIEKNKNKLTDEIQHNLVLLHKMMLSGEYKDLRDIVFEKDFYAIVPSKFAVNITLKNAKLGKTTYDLKLDRGVLTSFSFNKPAELVELAKLPLVITGEIVTQLSSLITFRIDMVGKTQEYIDAMVKLKEAEHELDILKIKLERDDVTSLYEYEKLILESQLDIIQKSTEIQTAIIEGLYNKDLSEYEIRKKIIELQAQISEKQLIIEQNKKAIDELKSEKEGY